MASSTESDETQSQGFNPDAAAGCATGVVFVLLVIGAFWLTNNIENFIFPPTHSSQLEKLDEIQENLGALFYFIEDQKQSLKQQEQTIKDLEDKSKELRPIVEADENLVEQILAAHAKTQSNNVWWERAISFLIGVVSSLVASKLYGSLSRRNSGGN